MKTTTYIKYLVKTDNARKGFVYAGAVNGCDCTVLTADKLVKLGYLTNPQPATHICNKCLRYEFTADGLELVNKHRTQKKQERS